MAVLIALVIGTAAGVGVAGAATDDDPALATTEWNNVTITQEYRLQPDTPGHIEVTATVTFPEAATEFEVAVPWQGTVTDTDGFESTVGRRYEWTGERDEATITYDLDANETARGGGPERGSGRYLYADTGSWALVKPPSIGFVSGTFRSVDDDVQVGVDRKRTVAGEGAAGDYVAFLGPHETYRRTAHGQSFTLIVPEAASMTAEPEAILAAFANASDELRVGDRDEQVFTVAAPTSVDWAVLGLQTWESDMWVRADEPIATADNTWLHEYVHSRQQLNTTNATEWLIEATATYHAAELALEDDLTDFDSFEEVLARGSRDRYDEVVLAEQATWTSLAEYDKGALVAGELDRQIRLATDRSKRFETVFGDLNDDIAIDHDRFIEAVETAANKTVAATADRYVTSDATPATWTRRQHEDAFGSAPAEFTHELASDAAPYRIEGPYRNVSTDDIDRLAVNETVVVPLTVSNVGGSTGTYDIGLTVEGTVVSRVSGTLAANESATIELAHTFEDPGTYSVAIESSKTTIRVTEPASASVESVAVDRETLEAPGNVTLSATLVNDRDEPARTTVTFTRNGTTVAERTVSLAPGASKPVEATVILSDAGRYELGVNGRTTTVVVDPARFTYAVDETADITVDGEYRTVTGAEIPPLVVGETVTIPVTVTNDGGVAGTYRATLSIDGAVATQSTGTLAAGESTTLTLSATFDRPGSYRLTTGHQERRVQVSERATPTVRSVAVDRSTLPEPGNVTISAAIVNDSPIPAAGEINFTRNGTVFAVESVSLDVNETLSVAATVTLPRSGTFALAAGDQSTTVTVTTPTGSVTQANRFGTADGTETTTATGPGFTALGGLLVVVVTALAVIPRY
ncbi:Putative metalloprotease, contains C-terminal PDZ domain [Halorhabdus sp. BNX81]|nr:Putative metalloprotease, contains C-terminal PDZ domain [Halorhabdus sp. BNX81]